MSKYRFFTQFSAIFAGLSLAGYALICRADEATEPSLYAIPVSSKLIHEETAETLRALNAAYPKHPLDMKVDFIDNPFEPSICKDDPDGCLLIEYMDSAALTMLLDPNPQYQNQILRTMEVTGTPQFFYEGLLTLARVQFMLFDNWECRISGKKPSRGCILLQQTGIERARAGARSVLGQARQDLVAQGSLSEATQSAIRENPLVYKDLPTLYRETTGKPAAQSSVEEVTLRALRQALKALTRSAFSTSPTFPYAGGDPVTPETFVTADWAAKKLAELDRAVPIRALSLDARKSLSESCKDYPKTDEDRGRECKGLLRKSARGHWMTLAAYSPSENVIYVDYSEDFYEALYALQHETWHALVENTSESQRFRDRVGDLAGMTFDGIADPQKKRELEEGRDLTLKQTIFYKVIQDELAAIQQSNWLYRFAGHLTHQWAEKGGKDTPSAKGWYDAEYGDELNEKLYLPRSERLVVLDLFRAQAKAAEGHGMNSASSWIRNLSTAAAFLPPPAPFVYFDSFLYKNGAAQSALEKIRSRINSSIARLSVAAETLKQRVLVGMPPEVLEVFSERYRLSLPDFAEFEQKTKLAELTFEKPRPVSLTCDQAEHIASLMPKEWEHGLPFSFVAKNPDGTPCFGPGGTDPGVNGGTHPGVNGGTHPEISFLPCLDGRKEE